MTIYRITRFGWRCPSCGTALTMVVSVPENGRPPKWLHSVGVWWGRKLGIGDVAPAHVECALCRTEFERSDWERLSQEAEASGEKPGDTNGR